MVRPVQVVLSVTEGIAGRVARERKIINIPDLNAPHNVFTRAALLKGEGFAAYHAAPLISEGQVIGVLEVFHRAPLDADRDWQAFFQGLAEQTAIAIDSATLFTNLERSNADLKLAYDATIVGWSHALDLRDKETQGHTQRVTQGTIQLARAYGLGEDAIVHIRRGALLHDMGKMGVPDNIIRKPGPLTEEEWVSMRKHPLYAYDMLAPIAYLRLALDIPYCHHEKWDGSGYPRQLRGEQIPLPARIFAVVDVWDALTSERPYRKAWTEGDARMYIHDQAGIHFDPEVVSIFLRQIQDPANLPLGQD